VAKIATVLESPYRRVGRPLRSVGRVVVVVVGARVVVVDIRVVVVVLMVDVGRAAFLAKEVVVGALAPSEPFPQDAAPRTLINSVAAINLEVVTTKALVGMLSPLQSSR
jgi:hypothetical protein